jgi:hypothetical protein
MKERLIKVLSTLPVDPESLAVFIDSVCADNEQAHDQEMINFCCWVTGQKYDIVKEQLTDFRRFKK